MPPRKREERATFDVRQELGKDADPDRVLVVTARAIAETAKTAEVCPHCGAATARPAAPAPSAPPVPAPPARYRVTKGGTFVAQGSICTLRAGDIVLLRVHGAAGIANMRGRGLILEPIKD